MTEISSLIHTYINDDDTWIIPFGMPFIFWMTSYLHCMFHKRQFHKWYTIHNIHNFGAIILGSISIYTDHIQNSSYHSFVLNERIPILWSSSYFIIDIIDCCIRQDVPYLFHALCCFILGYMNYTIPILRHLHMNSKATYCELSNPFMHLAKRTRNPMHFLLFAIVFTCCRMLWLPIMYHQLISFVPSSPPSLVSSPSIISPIVWYHPSCCVLIAFYGLNVFWYIKIINIIITGGKNQTKELNHETTTIPVDTKKTK